MARKKLFVFHPALAPYRIDFFNSLSEHFDSSFYFFNRNLMNQKFDQIKLQSLLKFKCQFLRVGINFFGRSIRFGIVNVLLKNKPDVVICSEYNPGIIFVLLYRVLFKKQFTIYTICDDNVMMAERINYVKKALRKISVHYLDGIIFTNDEIVEWYRANLDTRAKLIVFPIIRNEQEYQKKIEASTKIANGYLDKYGLVDKKNFLFVGRLSPVKNLDRLVRAFESISSKYHDARLIIVGSGELEVKLKDLVNSLGLDDLVLFPGRFEEEELIAWYLVSGVFILPSTNELFGAVINEALCSGCYVLTSNRVGAKSLIVEGLNGSLFHPQNIQEIFTTIETTLKKDILFKDQGMMRNNRMLRNYQDYLNPLLDQLN